MSRFLVFLLVAVSSTFADEQLQKDIQDFHRTFKDMGGGNFQINPNPFFCNSVPTFAPCAQPAIPICCGPCFQSGGVPAQPQNPPVAAGTPAPAATAAPPPPPPATPFVPPPTVAATEAPAGTVAPAGTAAPAPEGTTPGASPPNSSANCPIACPAGWNQWGPTSEHCYLMPAQPAKLDTFWSQEAYCKNAEPTSYILVVDGLIEQALGSAVAFQYAANWLALGTNGFLWLGGYTDGSKWNYLDGTDQSGNILMTAANVLSTKENGTCLGADPKTLGIWQTRSCSDNTGAVICEMPKRPVCGATGGMLPVSPISLTVDSLKNLFPKMPSIPFLGQILGGGGGLTGGLTNAANGVADTLGLKSGLGGLLGAAAELERE